MSEQETPQGGDGADGAGTGTDDALAYLRRPELAGPTTVGRAAILLDQDLHIVWSNPAGARLLGAADLASLRRQVPPAGATLLRQAGSAARRALDGGGPLEAVVRTRSEFRTRLVTVEAAACAPGVLLTTDGDGTAAADDLAALAFDAAEDDEEAALLSEDGAVEDASQGFAALGLNADRLAANRADEDVVIEGADGRHRVRFSKLGDRTVVLARREPEPAEETAAVPLVGAAVVTGAEARRWFYRGRLKAEDGMAVEADREISQTVEDVRETFDDHASPTGDADAAALLTLDPEAQDEAPMREAAADEARGDENDAAEATAYDGDGPEPPSESRPVGFLTRAASSVAATALGAAGLVRTVRQSGEETNPKDETSAVDDDTADALALNEAEAGIETEADADIVSLDRERAGLPIEDPDGETAEGSVADEEGRASLLALDGVTEEALQTDEDDRETEAVGDRSVTGFVGAALYAPPAEGFKTMAKPPRAEVDDETEAAPIDFRFRKRERATRFVWSVDAEQRFATVSEALAEAVGPAAAVAEGEAWPDAARRLGIDDDGAIAGLLERGDTWSGRTVLWPVDGEDLRVPVDLAGLPAFDRDRNFTGFNGFGIVRTADAVPDRGHVREEAPEPETEAETSNVIDMPERRALSQDDQATFERIGAHLGSAAARVEPDGDIAPLDFETPEPAELIEDIVEDVEDDADESTADLRVQVAEVRDVDTSILARLPIPVLAYRGDTLLFANAEFFRLTGYDDLHELADAGGVDALFGEHRSEDDLEGASVLHREGHRLAVEAHLQTVPWDHERAMLLTLKRDDGGNGRVSGSNGPTGGGGSESKPSDASPSGGAAARAQRLWRAGRGEGATGEHPFAALPASALHDILDTGTEGVLILDAEGEVRALNRPAEALFGIDAGQIVGEPFVRLLAPESHRTALDYLSGLTGPGVASMLNDGREVIGRVGADLAGSEDRGLLPLTLTIGRIRPQDEAGDEEADDADDAPLYCAVLRDMTQWKRTEEDLVNARSEAERLSGAKSEFLTTVSHEVRNPLTAIIGFSEMMVEERFGPLGSDRYLGYARDIRSSGKHVLDIVNDLLDISKIEAGEMRLDFGSVALNTVVTETVAMSQPQANRERIVIRTSLSAELPPVVADERSIRQIVLNLVSNALRYTRAGGQVIVSTAGDEGDVVLRVRDTGIGMDADELARALQPFRQNAQSGTGHEPGERGGTGLGLPLTKAMVEANRAVFAITSTPQEGTMVEMRFPPQRVLTH